MELLSLAITAAAYLAAPVGIWWYYHSKGFSLSNKQAVWIAVVNAVIIKFLFAFWYLSFVPDDTSGAANMTPTFIWGTVGYLLLIRGNGKSHKAAASPSKSPVPRPVAPPVVSETSAPATKPATPSSLVESSAPIPLVKPSKKGLWNPLSKGLAVACAVLALSTAYLGYSLSTCQEDLEAEKELADALHKSSISHASKEAKLRKTVRLYQNHLVFYSLQESPCYHAPICDRLEGFRTVSTCSLDEAKRLGLSPCLFCIETE